MIDLVAGFQATYLLHSTLALGLTLALVRLPRLRSAAARDLLLRVALLAPLGTAAAASTQVPGLSAGQQFSAGQRSVSAVSVPGVAAASSPRDTLPATIRLVSRSFHARR